MSHRRTTELSEVSSSSSRFAYATRTRVSISAGVVAAIVYLLTMYRAVGFLDSGEVAAAAATLGVMHPTGYPTMTMLGWLVATITPFRDILALNTFAALLAAAGIAVMTLLFDHILRIWSQSIPTATKSRAHQRSTTSAKRIDRRREASKRSLRESELAVRTSAAGTGASESVHVSQDLTDNGARALTAGLLSLFIGFTAIWWEQATSFEVYALQALLLPLVSYLFFRYVDTERRRRDDGDDHAGFTLEGILFAVSLGLAFTNHMMTAFLAPACLLYYFLSLRVNAGSFRRILYLIPPFAAGLLPYLYLPIRSAMHPLYNWGRPDTWQRFVDHVSGRFAWEWMFSDSEVYSAQTSYFFDRLPSEFAYVGLVIAAVGVIVLARRNMRVAVWAATAFATCVAYAGGYRIYDIELYYATAVLALGVCSLGAFAWLLERRSHVAVGLAAALVIANIVLHYRSGDRSDNHLGEDLAYNTLATAPRNTIVFSSNAATLVTATYYLQSVEGLRPDVTVINQDYLSLTWYLDELATRRPDVMNAVADEVARYRVELDKVERGDEFDSFRLTNEYDRMLQAMVDWQMSRGNVLVAGEVERAFGTKYAPVPWHLGYRLTRDTGYVSQPFPSYRFQHWDHIDPFAASVYETYGRRLSYRASYEAAHGRDSLATMYRTYALSFDPTYDLSSAPELPLDGMSQVQATSEFYARLRQSVGR